MALAPRLDLRQSQQLVMTPQLQQAIRLLAMSNLELENWLADAIDGNPLLDSGDDDARGDAGGDDDRGGGDGHDGGNSDEDWSDDGPAADVPDASAVERDWAQDGTAPLTDQIDADFAADTFHHDCAIDAVLPGGSGSDGEDSLFDRIAAPSATLHDHLLGQAGEIFDGAERVIAHQLIGMIGEAGYLHGSTIDLAEALGVPHAAVLAVLARVQQFDPSGVGARDLAECLAIQAREADRYDPAMARLIDNLDLLARGALPQLRRLCGVDEEDMADMIRELRAYDPKPGARFGGAPPQTVVPDILVRARGDGWAVELNGATLPRLLVNRRYYAELSRRDGGRSKGWLADQLAEANWLVRALDQRQQTILRVASEIVVQQDGFFRHGVAMMRALTLRQVAEAIDMHESTVSRVTSGKYLSCPRGLFELKYFFSSGVASASGDGSVSAEAIKNRITQLIASEAPGAILSDDAIAAMLVDEGHQIARRTVVKYREAMGIGSSVQRRRQKALAG